MVKGWKNFGDPFCACGTVVATSDQSDRSDATKFRFVADALSCHVQTSGTCPTFASKFQPYKKALMAHMHCPLLR
jgi:hypothetical protein